MQKLYNVFIRQTFMDFDLTHELNEKEGYFQFGSLLDQTGFLDDLDCEDFLCFFRDQLVASGEPALPQEVAFNIPGDCVVFEAVILNEVQVFVGFVMTGVRST